MNKARMTFRFNEESSHKPESAQKKEEKAIPTKSEERVGQDLPRLEHVEASPTSRYETPRKAAANNRDHLTVISGPIDGWSDPFNKEDPWSEMLAGQQPFSEREDSEERYDLDALDHGDGYIDHTDDWRNLADAVYPEIGEGTYRPRKPASPWKIIGTITGAIVTGALFGFVVLSFFKDGSEGSIIPVKPSAQSAAPAQAGGNQTVPVTVQVQSQSYYMLQYGVFSNQERALQAQKELQQFGIAAGQDPDQENRVYAGMSTDRDQAKLLSSQLKSEGIELYVKEISLPAATQMEFAGDAGIVNQYFAVSSELVSKLSQLSASLLAQENPPALDEENQAALTNLHSRWLESIKSLQTGIGNDAEELGTQMEQSMNSAISAITEYDRNRSKGHLWEVQSGMMQYIALQKQLISSLEKA